MVSLLSLLASICIIPETTCLVGLHNCQSCARVQEDHICPHYTPKAQSGKLSLIDGQVIAVVCSEDRTSLRDDEVIVARRRENPRCYTGKSQMSEACLEMSACC